MSDPKITSQHQADLFGEEPVPLPPTAPPPPSNTPPLVQEIYAKTNLAEDEESVSSSDSDQSLTTLLDFNDFPLDLGDPGLQDCEQALEEGMKTPRQPGSRTASILDVPPEPPITLDRDGTLLTAATIACDSATARNHHGLRHFIDGSALRYYLGVKFPQRKFLDDNLTTLHDVFVCLRTLIKRERMYDELNPMIIICDQALTIALGSKFIFASDIGTHIQSQFKRLNFMETFVVPKLSASRFASSPNPYGHAFGPSAEIYKHSLANVDFPASTLFGLRTKFLRVICSTPGVPHDRKIYKYHEVTHCLGQYLKKHQDRLFSHGNPAIAYCENDLLGEAFGVRAFHRSQVVKLLRAQLVPLYCSPDLTQAEVSSHDPLTKLATSGKPPSLSKAPKVPIPDPIIDPVGLDPEDAPLRPKATPPSNESSGKDVTMEAPPKVSTISLLKRKTGPPTRSQASKISKQTSEIIVATSAPPLLEAQVSVSEPTAGDTQGTPSG